MEETYLRSYTAFDTKGLALATVLCAVNEGSIEAHLTVEYCV